MYQFVPSDDRLSRILERDWHADIIEFVRTDVPRLVAVLLLAFLLQRLVAFAVSRLLRIADRQVGNLQRASQLRTMATIIRATSYGVIGFIVLLHVLSIFSINLTPLLASAGVVGVGIGLGAQSIFKDMLNGVFILVEDQYNVGEVVRIASLTGTVEDLTLRLTRLRDGDGSLYVIPNSQVAIVSNLSRDYSLGNLTLSVDVSANPDLVIATLKEITAEIRRGAAFENVFLEDPKVVGVDKIDGRAIQYPILFRVRPNQKDDILRALRRQILLTFEQKGIPFGTNAATLFTQASGAAAASGNDHSGIPDATPAAAIGP